MAPDAGVLVSADIHPACALCRGACCEGIVLPSAPYGEADANRWLCMHGTPEDAEWLYVPAPCRHLKEGRCSIYEDRPRVCSDFIVGGKLCHRAIKRNRPNQEVAILRLLCSV